MAFFSNKYFLEVAYICEIVALNIQKNLKKIFLVESIVNPVSANPT